MGDKKLAELVALVRHIELRGGCDQMKTKKPLGIVAAVSLGAFGLIAPAAQAADVSVAVWSDSRLDSDVGCSNESLNLRNIIGGTAGYSVDSSITDLADPNLEVKLNSNAFFFVPDIEDPTLATVLPDSAKPILRDWVSAGGVLVQTGTYGSKDVDFLNAIFSLSLTNVNGSSWTQDATNVSGTPFGAAGSPATLSNLSATDAVDGTNVPGANSFTPMWGTTSNATVSTMTYGSGTIIFMSYDFFNAGPSCGVTGSGWVDFILPAALDYAAALSNAGLANATTSGGDLSYTVSQSGSYYWAVVPRAATAPTAAELKAQVDYGAVVLSANGTGTLSANVAETINLNTLTEATQYSAYLVTEYDNNGTPTFTAVEKVDFSTLPGTPTVSVAAGDTKATVTISPSGSETNFEYSIDGGSTWVARSPASVSSPWEITGLTNGTSYSMRFRSVFDNLKGAATADSTFTPSAVAAPTLTDLGTIDPFIVGADVNVSAPANSSDAVSTWSISPALPDGLSLDASTGVISGAAASAFAATEFTITGTNAGGSDSATVTLSAYVPDPTYRGPVISVGQVSSTANGQVTLSGSQLQGVTEIYIAGKNCEFLISDGSLLLTIPEGVAEGVHDLVIISGYGRLTVQDAIKVVPEPNKVFVPIASRVSKFTESSYKLYAFDVVGAGKVQFFHNGKETAWVRAASESDPKLRDQDYFVRTLPLMAGSNMFEVFVQGKLVRQINVDY